MMKRIYPDYYKDFSCIGGSCKHNCCIGWEIDIDKQSHRFYNELSGPFGDRLRSSIDNSDPPHFITDKNDRCPFLNKDNLCDIIVELGQEHICEICTRHPRFYNELPDRVEMGIGLTCEEAARIIISKKEPVCFIGAFESKDEIIALRDRLITLLQDRSRTIEQRCDEILSMCSITLPDRTVDEWIEFLLGLERLDETWSCILNRLSKYAKEIDLESFDRYMSSRQTEYEQLLVYFIYRHFANAYDMEDASARAAFAVFAYRILRLTGALYYTENKCFTTSDNAELARLFSSEIEYSQENLDALLDEMLF